MHIYDSIAYISVRIKYKAHVVGKQDVEEVHEEHEHKDDELKCCKQERTI